MGVLNITPDSFSDGGNFLEVDKAVAHAKEMVAAGADIIDIGGESSRPGSDAVSVEEELQRVVPVIKRLVEEGMVVSLDTTKPEVARKGLELGVSLINDISGLRDPEMISVCEGVPVVIMHMKGLPKTMQKNPVYGDVVEEISEFFSSQIKKATQAGITELILDPGIGFGKKLEHNVEILRRLGEFKKFGYPILIGPSRKNFIGVLTGLPSDQRVLGTVGAVCAGVMNGASIVRVHDIEECKQALKVVDAIKG